MAVTPADVAVALGRTSPAIGSTEEAQWAMWIGDALLLIGARLGDVTLLDQAKLDYVVREAVVAQVRKPDDATQVQVAVDDANMSRTYSSSRGRVHILDEWWDLLSPVPTSGAFVLDTAPNYLTHLLWCSINFGATYCSCGVDIALMPIFEYGVGE
jgi:hypothetical protein